MRSSGARALVFPNTSGQALIPGIRGFRGYEILVVTPIGLTPEEQWPRMVLLEY
jgi:hypothetical protein